MGKKDIALLRYFEDEDRYADLINGYVFSGKQAVSGSDILEMNAAVPGIFHRLKEMFAFQKYRDAISVLTGSKELEDVKEKYRENGGKINMCEAIRGMIENSSTPTSA